MPKYAQIHIIESIEELQSLLKKEKNHRMKVRIKSLILTKEKRFKRRQDLADYLCIGISTLKRWTKEYQKEGIGVFLTPNTGGHRESVISEEIHNALCEKLQDSKDPLRGYNHAVEWVRVNYGEEIYYNTLRQYIIRNFKTKLKTPRKSHYKKDEEAYEAFKKNSRHNKVI